MLVAEGGSDAAAAGVTADYNVLDFKIVDGKFDDGKGRKVGVADNVCYVAVGENIAGFQTQDSGLGTSRIRASDPENTRRLALGQVLEIGGV